MGLYAIGVLLPDGRYNPGAFDYVSVRFETEVWQNSKGDSREEAVGATVTYDLSPAKATFFNDEYAAFDALNDLKRLDREGKVTRESFAWGEGAATPLIEQLVVIALTESVLDAPARSRASR